MKSINYQVRWSMTTFDGEEIKEEVLDEQGIVFSKELLNQYAGRIKELRMTEVRTGRYAKIDTITGKVEICGVEIGLAKEVLGRNVVLTGLPDVNYQGGLIQYKESLPMSMLVNAEAIPKAHYIGYKVPVPNHICKYEKNGVKYTLTNLVILISFEILTREFAISINPTFEFQKGDEVRMLRL